MQNFEEIFRTLLMAAVADKSEERKIVPERYKVLGDLYNMMSELTGTTPDMRLYPNFSTGSVCVEVSHIDFGPDEVAAFRDVLIECNTFEAYPLTDGNVKIAVTVNGVFETKE